MVIYNQRYGDFVGSQRGYCGFRNKLRIDKFIKLINPRESDRILEIGCNKGLLTLNIAKYSSKVTGIDINKQQIRKINNNMFCLMSATELNFPSNHFDKMCAFEVIEHIREIDKVFSEVYRVLKMNGRFIISFPFEFIRGQSAILDACLIYKNPFYARKLHLHRLTPHKIRKIIGNLPFSVVRSIIMFIPFPSFVMVLRKEI